MTAIRVNVRTNNNLAFLGHGYIFVNNKKVFVRMYVNLSLDRLYVRIYHHHGYGFVWNDFIVDQGDFKYGTILVFNVNRMREMVEHSYNVMDMLSQILEFINFKLL